MTTYTFILMYSTGVLALGPSTDYAFECVLREPHNPDATVVEIDAVDLQAAIAGVRDMFN